MRPIACLFATLLLSSSFARAQTSVDPCSLLTKEDAAAAMGSAVTKGPESTKTQGPAACTYEGAGVNRVHLNVFPMSANEMAMYRSLCAQKTKDGLAGLGEMACWYNAKHEELQVIKGNTMFSIELRRGGDPTEAIKEAARRVVGRLK